MDILKLANISEDLVSIVGGKAKNLNKLIEAGFLVPEGFVVTSKGYQYFIESCELKDKIKQVELLEKTSDLQLLYKSIQNTIRQSKIPSDLAKAIVTNYNNLNSRSVAVRSSGASEDSGNSSFAGQFETYLNITNEQELLKSILQCWASFWSERALTYRSSQEISFDSEGIAIVVQTMVKSQISGVIFTQNPVTENRHELLIESSFGLGEAIVSGKTMTDAFVVDSQEKAILERTINYKLNMCVFDSELGIRDIKVPKEKRSIKSLTDAQVIELANLGLKVRELYQSEQDIEWGFDGEKIHLLQSRPITTVNRSHEAIADNVNKPCLLTCLDIGESFTGVFTPLGESFTKYYLKHTHGPIFSALGLRDVGDPANYGKFIYGRAYLDISYFAYLHAQSILFRDQNKFLERFASEEINLDNYENPYGKGLEGLSFLQSNIFFIKAVIRDLLTFKRRGDDFLKKRIPIFEEYLSLDTSQLSLQELHQKLKEAYEYYHDSCVIYITPYIWAFFFYDILKDISKQWFPHAEDSIPELLKAGASELRTTEMIFALENLALEARHSPEIKQLILNNSPKEVLEKLKQYCPSQTFWDKYQILLRENGVRAHHEMELTNPRWADDPTYVFATLKTYLTRDDHQIVEERKLRNQERITKATKALKQLPFYKRKIYEFVMDSYLKLSTVREDLRMCFIQGIWMNRLLVMEVGRRLVAEKILQNIDEIGFISYEDILSYTAEEHSPWELFSRNKINLNRRQYSINKQIPTPPLTFISHWNPTTTLTDESSKDVLVGLGSSQGKIIGKARVIINLEEQMDEFEPGEIIVTRFTDTTWTPLFYIASAVVADIGSLLSHSSIVARELGIPAVVNTKIATQAISTGDTLIVDGNKGEVYLKKDSYAPN